MDREHLLKEFAGLYIPNHEILNDLSEMVEVDRTVDGIVDFCKDIIYTEANQLFTDTELMFLNDMEKKHPGLATKIMEMAHRMGNRIDEELPSYLLTRFIGDSALRLSKNDSIPNKG